MDVAYTPGPGTLLGAGHRWILLAGAPTSDTPVEQLWTLLTAPVLHVDAVLAQVAAGWGPETPLVLVDTTPGAGTTHARGAARLTTLAGVHTLDLDLDLDLDPTTVTAETAETAPPLLPLLGGVVRADRAVLRPSVAPDRGAPEVSRGAPTAAPTDTPRPRVLIDGIPPEILAGGRPGATTATPATPADAAPTGQPAPSAGRSTQTPQERTVRRAVVDSDHDGHTTFRPGQPGRPGTSGGSHLEQPTSETVLAVRCPRGHVSAAFAPTCRVCGDPVPAQEPQRLARPVLGALVLPDGERVSLDRGVVLGRMPEPTAPVQWPHLVRLPAESTYVSRSHLSIELDGWLVLATDLGSRGGTTLRVPGRAPERIRSHEPYVWEPGQVLDLADSYEIVYEVTG